MMMLASSSDEIKPNENHLNNDLLKQDELINETKSFANKPKHSRIKPTNVWTDESGSCLLEKQSSSEANVFNTKIVVPSKSIPPKARTAIHLNQFVRRNEKKVVEQDLLEDDYSEEQSDYLLTPQHHQPKTTLGDFLFISEPISQPKNNNNKKMKQNLQNRKVKQTVSTGVEDDLIATTQSLLTQSDIDSHAVSQLKTKITKQCEITNDEKKLSKLLEILDILSAF
jgi:hypothetical protein